MCLVDTSERADLLVEQPWGSFSNFRKARSYGDFAALNDASDGDGDACNDANGMPAKRRAGSTENLLKLEALAKAQAARVPVLGNMAVKSPSRVRVSFELPEPAEQPSSPAALEQRHVVHHADDGRDCDGHCQVCTLGRPDSVEALERRFVSAPAILPAMVGGVTVPLLPLADALERAAAAPASTSTLPLADALSAAVGFPPPPPPPVLEACPLGAPSALPPSVAARPCSLFTLVEPPSLITPSPTSVGASPPSSYSSASPFGAHAASPFSASSIDAASGISTAAMHSPQGQMKHSRSEEAISSHLALVHEPPPLLDHSASLGTACSLDLAAAGSGRIMGSADSLPLTRASIDSCMAISSHLSEGSAAEELFYRLNHARQTVDFVKRQAAHFSTINRAEMDVWEALATLDTLREYETALLGDDDCDPTMGLQEHALQTAEACRLAYPDEDWLHLVGLIHDLGKLLAHKQWGGEPQWAVCGETYPVGCRFHPSILHSQFFSANPDRRRRAFSTTTGMYQPGCGLNSVYMSWSAAEYLYMVLLRNKAQLPPEALYVIRYHRCAVLLRPGSPYSELLSEFDRRCLPWVKRFRELARYTRRELPGRLEGQALRDYYDGLVRKYMPQATLRW